MPPITMVTVQFGDIGLTELTVLAIVIAPLNVPAAAVIGASLRSSAVRNFSVVPLRAIAGKLDVVPPNARNPGVVVLPRVMLPLLASRNILLVPEPPPEYKSR